MLKKLKSKSKFVGIFLLILMLGLPLTGAVVSAYNYLFNSNHLVKIGKKKITKETLMHLNSNQKLFMLLELIEKDIVEGYASKLNLSIPIGKIDDEYKKKLKIAKDNVPNVSESAAIKAHYQKSKNELRKSIKFDLLKSLVSERVSSMYTPSKKEIDEYFESNYENEKLADVKDEIVAKLKEQNSDSYFSYLLEKEIDEVSSSIDVEELKDFLPKKFLILGNLSVPNYIFAKLLSIYSSNPFFLRGVSGKSVNNKAFNMVYNTFESSLLLAKEAQSLGLRSKRNLSSVEKIENLAAKMKDRIKNSIEIFDKDLKDHYNANISSYTTVESANVNIIHLPFKYSSNDALLAKNRAENLLEEAISSNELPSSMRIERDSVTNFKSKFNRNKLRDGEVIPKLLGSGNRWIIAKRMGEDVIYVEIVPAMSDNSRNQIIERANSIFDRISNQELTIEKAVDIYSDSNFRSIKEVTADKNLEKELIDSIFNNSELTKLITDKGIYIFKRSTYRPNKVASFEESKKKVEDSLRRVKFEKALKEELERLRDKYEIKVSDSFLSKYKS